MPTISCTLGPVEEKDLTMMKRFLIVTSALAASSGLACAQDLAGGETVFRKEKSAFHGN